MAGGLIEHKKNVRERLGEETYTIKEGDTLAAICQAYGISHADILIEANPDLLKGPPDKEEARAPHLISLEAGKTLKIPPLKVGMKRAARGPDFEGAIKPYVFQLRDPDLALPVSLELARRQGMELALSAYLTVAQDHKTTATKISRFFEHQLSSTYRHGKTDLILSGLVTGISVAILMATGPVGVGIMMAIAAGGYVFNKLAGWYKKRKRREKLLSYWQQDLTYGRGESYHAKTVDKERTAKLNGTGGMIRNGNHFIGDTDQFKDFDVGRKINIRKRYLISKYVDEHTIELAGAEFSRDMSGIQWKAAERSDKIKGSNGRVRASEPNRFTTQKKKFQKFEEDQYLILMKTCTIAKRIDGSTVELDESLFSDQLSDLEWKIEGTVWHKAKDTFSENRGFALSADAEFILRRCVVHMRKARQLLGEDVPENKNGDHTEGMPELQKNGQKGDLPGGYSNGGQTEVIIDVESKPEPKSEEKDTVATAFCKKDQGGVRFKTCEDMIEHAKYGMKFIYEVDKFKNYLLPAIVHLVFFIESHQEYVNHWRELARELEKPIIDFFARGDHSRCMSAEKVVTYQGKEHFCILEAADYQRRKKLKQTLVDPDTSIQGGFGVETLKNAEVHLVKKPETDALILDMGELVKYLTRAAEKIQAEIKANRLWAGYFDPEENSEVELDPKVVNDRYEIFKRDLLAYHNSPSLWEKTKHKFQNYNLARSKAEKGIDFLSEAFAIGWGVIGGAYVGEVIESLEGTEKIIKKVAKSGVSPTVNKVIIPAVKSVGGVGKGRDYTHTSVLLPYSDKRAEVSREGAVNDPGLKKDGKMYKEGAIKLDQLFKSIARHYVNAFNLEENLKKELREAADKTGQVAFKQNCGAHFAFAKELYKFHYEFDKMERHLWAVLTFVFDLLGHSQQLTEKEKEIRENFFDKTVKNWITGNNHGDCRLSKWRTNTCYGPASEDPHAAPIRRMDGADKRQLSYVRIKSVNNQELGQGGALEIPLRKTINVDLVMEPKSVADQTPGVTLFAQVVDAKGHPVLQDNGNPVMDGYRVKLKQDRSLKLLFQKDHETQIKDLFKSKAPNEALYLLLALGDPNNCLISTRENGREVKLKLLGTYQSKIFIEKLDREDKSYHESETIAVDLALDPPLNMRNRKAVVRVRLLDGEQEVCKSEAISIRKDQSVKLEIPEDTKLWKEGDDPAQAKKLTLVVEPEEGCSPMEGRGEKKSRWEIDLNKGRRQIIFIQAVEHDVQEGDKTADTCFLRKIITVRLGLEPRLGVLTGKARAEVVFRLLAGESGTELGRETRTAALHENNSLESRILKTYEKQIRKQQGEVRLEIAINAKTLEKCAIGNDKQTHPDTAQLKIKKEYEPKLEITALDPDKTSYYAGENVTVKFAVRPAISLKGRNAEVRILARWPDARVETRTEQTQTLRDHESADLLLNHVGKVEIRVEPNESGKEAGPGCSIKSESACRRTKTVNIRYFKEDISGKSHSCGKIKFNLQLVPPRDTRKNKPSVIVTITDTAGKRYHRDTYSMRENASGSFQVKSPGKYLIKLETTDNIYSVDETMLKKSTTKSFDVT